MNPSAVFRALTGGELLDDLRPSRLRPRLLRDGPREFPVRGGDPQVPLGGEMHSGEGGHPRGEQSRPGPVPHPQMRR